MARREELEQLMMNWRQVVREIARKYFLIFEIRKYVDNKLGY